MTAFCFRAEGKHFENDDVTIIRGESRGRVQEEGAGGGCRLSNTTGILRKKKKNNQLRHSLVVQSLLTNSWICPK